MPRLRTGAGVILFATGIVIALLCVMGLGTKVRSPVQDIDKTALAQTGTFIAGDPLPQPDALLSVEPGPRTLLKPGAEICVVVLPGLLVNSSDSPDAWQPLEFAVLNRSKFIINGDTISGATFVDLGA